MDHTDVSPSRNPEKVTLAERLDIWQQLIALPDGAEHVFSRADLEEFHWWRFPNKPWEPRQHTPESISRMYCVDLRRDDERNTLVAIKRAAQVTAPPPTKDKTV